MSTSQSALRIICSSCSTTSPVLPRWRRRTRALPRRAGPERHVLLDPLAPLRRVRLLVASLEPRDDALEREHVRPPPPHAVAVLDVEALAVRAVEEEVLLLVAQLLPRQVRV